ncbi:alanyl-tRNA editing protein Aarsd1 isoform X1 [Schistocerca gregaria]|uniref:alanyl-tRNA editing protein Aarsd1 isoform X1 n=1 Tax=Schistocerca gregaria TaxID=7010 RepID=UPI00211E1DDE|nr:alanyl-tRNA editing protein Aarsd1 isoform X1 [Schistocerca gregaria]
MVFACQADSFLREFSSKVVSCAEAKLDLVKDGKKQTIDGFEVVLEDTILFPEGGGQPSDTGYLNETQVIQVNRRGAEAVHFVQSKFSVGETVKQKVDWERRFDHMQQHSGQHLLSAVGETEFNCPTTSWWLGEETSYVELATTSLTQSIVDKWEAIVNEKIRLALPVTVKVYSKGDPWLDEAHTRGLPKDHEGDVRVISIEGVDNNMCCGTHVSNLSQLQAIKFLYFEKGKKNKTNLHFLVGGRVLKYLSNCLEREKKLTELLQSNPNDHVSLVEKLQKSVKNANKNLVNALKEIAAYEVEKLKSQEPKPKFFCLHRNEAEMDFINMFLKLFADESVLLLLTVGEPKGPGHMVLHGEQTAVSALGQQICKLLDGKGAGKGTRFQAKVNNLKNIRAAEKLIKEYFQTGQNEV